MLRLLCRQTIQPSGPSVIRRMALYAVCAVMGREMGTKFRTQILLIYAHTWCVVRKFWKIRSMASFAEFRRYVGYSDYLRTRVVMIKFRSGSFLQESLCRLVLSGVEKNCPVCLFQDVESSCCIFLNKVKEGITSIARPVNCIPYARISILL